MVWFIGTILTGITAFAVTNGDDIVFLTIFFTQVNSSFRPWHIVVGQYIGFVILIVASLPGFFGGSMLPESWIGLLGLVPIALGINRLINGEEEDEAEARLRLNQLHPSTANSSTGSKITSFLNPQTYNVVAVEIANGGDSIGTYVPLFASSDLPSLGLILILFFLLMGVWCYIAYRLTNLPAIARTIARGNHALAPFVLIGLGIFILIECGTYQLLPPFR